MKCLCGCGQETTIFRRKSSKYIVGHNPKGNNSSKMTGEQNPMYGKKP